MDKLEILKLNLQKALNRQKRTEEQYEFLIEQKSDLEYELNENRNQKSTDFDNVANAEKAIYEHEDKLDRLEDVEC